MALGRREIRRSHASIAIHAMTTEHDIDSPAVLAKRPTAAHPDVLRELLATFIHTLMGAEDDASVRGRVRRTQHRAHQSTQRLPPSSIRDAHRHIGFGDPQVAGRNQPVTAPGIATAPPRPAPPLR